MRVYEAKLVYSLVSLGDETRLDKPVRIVEYLRSAFEENPMQEAFYAVYLDRKNHPIGRHLITLGTVDSTLVAPREVFRGAIIASASALVIAHNHPSGVMPHPVLCRIAPDFSGAMSATCGIKQGRL